MKKGVLRNFTNFTGKHLSLSLFFNKETLVEVFSCEFCEISKNTFLQNTSGRLLLQLPWSNLVVLNFLKNVSISIEKNALFELI